MRSSTCSGELATYIAFSNMNQRQIELNSEIFLMTSEFILEELKVCLLQNQRK